MLVQNHLKGPFDLKYRGDYRVVSLKGNQVEVQPASGGPTEMKHIKHVKYILPANRYINQLPDYPAFGRKTTLRMNPDHIPDLYWNLANMYHTTNIGYVDTQNTVVSTHYIEMETLSYARGDKCENWDGTILNTHKTVSQRSQHDIICSIILIT